MRRALLLGVALLVVGCGRAAPQAKDSHAPTAGHRAPEAKQRRASGIPSSLLAGVRPIGRGPRFQPPIRGPVMGACTKRLGRRLQAHVELFGANRVVLLAAAIGTRAPRALSAGRLTHARCFGAVVTLDPTGTVYFRPGRDLTVGDLFKAWGQPLTRGRIASFTGARVRAYVNGAARRVAPARVPLTQHAEIVLELGPFVPPHSRFAFPRTPPRQLG